MQQDKIKFVTHKIKFKFVSIQDKIKFVTHKIKLSYVS